MSDNFKAWIEETKKLHHEPEVLEVLEEMEADVSEESIKKGNLLTLKLCMEENRMLNIKEIKKACEFANGFDFHRTNIGNEIKDCIRLGTTSYYIQDTNYFNVIIYPLFLQRVVEGVNANSENIIISADLDFIDVRFLKDGETESAKNFNIDYNDIDQAKEQAIKYILDKL